MHIVAHAKYVGGERRRAHRTPVVSAGSLLDGFGNIHGIQIYDLSADGARVSQPRERQFRDGDMLSIVGSILPFERRCRVVAACSKQVRLHFVPSISPDSVVRIGDL
jgi:hypothetical protein